MNFSRGIVYSHAVSISDRTTRKLSLNTIFTGNLYFNSFHLLLGYFNFISLVEKKKNERLSRRENINDQNLYPVVQSLVKVSMYFI